MKKIFFSLCIAATIASTGTSASAAVVINEVYGGGGNSDAPFNQDFVELFNNGLTGVNLDGFQLQYKPPTSGSFSTFATLPSFTLNAGSFYLVSAGSGGSAGVALPTVNFVGSGTNLGATNGVVQLLASDGATVLDLIGYGTGTPAEGTAAPAGSNTTSLQRTGGIDTNNNSTDFTALTPTPVPEPTTAVMLLGGTGLLALMRRRR